MDVKEFFKWWAIATTVWEMVENFHKSGGTAISPAVIAQEVSKDLERRVFQGFLPPSALEDKDTIIQAAIDNHPLLQNFPKDEPPNDKRPGMQKDVEQKQEQEQPTE